MSTLVKPELRGHLRRNIIKAVIGGITFGFINMSLYYVFVLQDNKKRYAEFHRTYNPEEHLKRLISGGYLSSASGKK